MRPTWACQSEAVRLTAAGGNLFRLQARRLRSRDAFAPLAAAGGHGVRQLAAALSRRPGYLRKMTGEGAGPTHARERGRLARRERE